MATTLINPAAGWKAAFLQARTDASGGAVDDMDGEDARLYLELASAGIVKPIPTGFQVLEDSPVNMNVRIGSGTAEADVAILQGNEVGQGKYIIRNQDAVTEVTLNTAHATNARIDEIYLIVQDNAYDASARVLPRIAYRDGTPSGSPVAPGPDAAWDAYLLLAQISVPANDTTISNSQITDSRVFARGMQGGSAAGVMELFAGATMPAGSLLCNGQEVSRTTYSRLFSAIGTTWGVGNGSTTFNIPDMRGRYARGVAASGTGNDLAESFGVDTIPAHVHPMTHTHSTNAPSTASGAASVGAENGTSTRGLYANDDLPACSPVNNSFAHTHNLDLPSVETGGVSTPNTGNPPTSPEILPASMAVHYIIWT